MSAAIYIEHPHIVAVLLGGNAKKPRLKRVVVGTMAEPRTEDGNVVVDKQKHLQDEVAKFIKENKLSLGKTALLVGPDAMHYREFQIAFNDRKQIDRVIRFQAEGLLPSINIDELSVAYHVLSKSDKGSRLLVMAAEKDYIRKRLDALEVAGVAIEQVDCHLSGTLNLGLMHPALAKDLPPALWLDFAGTTALVSIVSQGQVLATRAFVAPYLSGATGGTARAEDSKAALKELAEQAGSQPGGEPQMLEAEIEDFGVDTLDEEEEVVVLGESTETGGIAPIPAKSDRLAAAPDVTPPAAAPTPEQPAGLPTNDSVNLGALEVADRIRRMNRDELARFVSRVAVEARRTLFMANAGVTPERLIVSGLGREGEALCSALGAELRMEQRQSVDLLEVVNPVDEKTRKPVVQVPDVGDLTYLCGVAMKNLGRDYTGVDFRQGELAAGTMMDYVRTPLAFAATLVFLFAGIMFILVLTQVQSLETAISDLRFPPRKQSLQKRYQQLRSQILSLDKEVLSDSERATVTKELGSYPLNDEEPIVEISGVQKRLNDVMKRLTGAATVYNPTPHNADTIMSLVLKAIHESEPSYDFALYRIDITQAEATVIFFASTSESEEERRIGKRGGRVESIRIAQALEKLAATETKYFSGQPSPVGQPRPFVSGDRRVAQVTYKMPLAKVPPPPKRPVAGAAKGAAK